MGQALGPGCDSGTRPAVQETTVPGSQAQSNRDPIKAVGLVGGAGQQERLRSRAWTPVLWQDLDQGGMLGDRETCVQCLCTPQCLQVGEGTVGQGAQLSTDHLVLFRVKLRGGFPATLDLPGLLHPR